MASKQRRTEDATGREPGRGTAPELQGQHDAGLAQATAPAHQLGGPATAAAGLTQAGNPITDRVALALCVVGRPAELTEHLVGLVERSALSDDRKSEIRDRLQADQAAAASVSAAITRAFGRDSAELRSSLLEGARAATDADLVAVIAARSGQPEASVQALCDDLGGWVGWWWEEEEEEQGTPGDYAAEESGA